MIAIPLAVAAAVTVGIASAQPLPDIAKGLPATWPPPGWASGVSVPGAAPTQATKTEPVELDKWVQAFPHVRVNRGLKAVEFDGVVAWDFHDKDAPRTELELLVCLPMRDKEHESLVQSKAKGAHVHAALLMIGLEPGAPGRIDFGAMDEKGRPGVQRIAPKGPEVTVEFLYTKNGKDVTDKAATWVTDEAFFRDLREQNDAARARMKERLERERKESGETRVFAGADINSINGPSLTFVFGGSGVGQMRNEQGVKVNVYNADELGTLIGLCTFGGETIGLTRVYSPDSGLDAPSFIANNAAIPPMDTPIRVRVTPAKRVLIEEEEEKAFPGLTEPTKFR